MVWFRSLSLGLFCNFIQVTKENVECMLNKYINDKWKVKPSMLHKEQISKTTSKLSPSQDFILMSSDIYSTHHPTCLQLCTDPQKITPPHCCHSFR